MSTPDKFYEWQDSNDQPEHIHVDTHLLIMRALQRENARLRYAADHDELTGLLNATAWRRSVQNQVEGGATIGIALIDLDRFKQVNDYLGHSVGDGLLAAFGERITSRVKAGVIAGRIGGDEFGIAVDLDAREDGVSTPYMLMDQAYHRLQLESAEFVAERDWEIRRLGFGVSIGVALSSYGHRLSFGMLMEYADEDLRDAKDPDSR